jgi:hypothetical protein
MIAGIQKHWSSGQVPVVQTRAPFGSGHIYLKTDAAVRLGCLYRVAGLLQILLWRDGAHIYARRCHEKHSWFLQKVVRRQTIACWVMAVCPLRDACHHFLLPKLCFMKYTAGLAAMLLSALSLRAQVPRPAKIISGKVMSASTGLPVNGATLTLLHQKTTFYTDASGSFSVTSSNDVLTISHIGFLSKKIDLSKITSLPLIIRLRDTTVQLAEVVVHTGYQSLPEERATASFVQIDNTLLNRRIRIRKINLIF